MTIYYLLLIGSVLIGVPLCLDWGYSEKKSKMFRALYCAIIFAAMFIIAAVRDGTGYDYNLYGGWYHELNFWDYDRVMAWSREKGFVVPLKIMTVLTSGWQPMFVVIGFIIAAGVVYYIYKYSGNPFISVAAFISLGLYYNSLNFMRQFIAAIIIAYALRYISSNQILRYTVLVLFATCFHFSAILMLPFYFILKIKLNWIVLAVYSVSLAVLCYFSYPIIEVVTKYFYKGYGAVENPHITVGLPFLYAVVFIIPFIAAFLLRNQLIEKNKFNSILINALFFAVFFMVIGVKHSVISRFMLNFIIAPVLLLAPDILSVIIERINKTFGGKNKRRRGVRRKLCFLTIVLFCIYALGVNTYFLFRNYNGVVPYQTVYSDKGDGGG